MLALRPPRRFFIAEVSMPDPMPTESTRWYALQSKPKQEERAEANLRGWGIETLSPKMREFRGSVSGGRSCRVTPLFPNYLFAHFDAAAMITKVRLTRGVHRVVGFGEYATPIDDEIIASIKARILDDGFVHQTDPQPGDTVEVIEGPLRSLVGVFERHLQGKDRVLILLTTLSACTRVQVATMSIRKATRSVA
jgi:transcriptional antiterminator RfaH